MTSLVMEASGQKKPPTGFHQPPSSDGPRPIERQIPPCRDAHTEAGGAFRFSYLRREVDRKGFRPLPGLARAVEGSITSESLFPLFAERVISSRRPDRESSLQTLGLSMDAAPFEILVLVARAAGG